MASTLESFMSYLRIPLLASSGIAAVLSGLLYFKQNEIIYPRNIPPDARTNIPRPSQFGVTDFEELMIPTPDGESLSAFYLRANKQHARNVTILMFHGNAGNIGYRLPIAKILEDDIGCNVLMLQYRGYGLSSGTPNEKGLMIDAQTGLDYIRQRAELRGTRIVLYGQSLGGAVSIGLAARNLKHGDIAGIILENTFTSIRKLIPSAFPPARYLAPLCHQLWPSEETLPQISGVPMLFLSGLKDEIVPPSHMARLYRICKSHPKIWKELPNGSHNDTVAEPGYFAYIDDFIMEHVVR
ncbi:BEM46 family protein-like protein [Zopfia rhizophila CBS 207.26]|uniref:BEM46 family protein-like protein n=1 Tax=Zopfia rhizophila CBS 207.26 TaxID=1314779 RepID=A0A6A6DJF9_9PEZI|nr:BEM46 family protein-like protein [Zopfia rhizophila CBS 207.26]